MTGDAFDCTTNGMANKRRLCRPRTVKVRSFKCDAERGNALEGDPEVMPKPQNTTMCTSRMLPCALQGSTCWNLFATRYNTSHMQIVRSNRSRGLATQRADHMLIQGRTYTLTAAALYPHMRMYVSRVIFIMQKHILEQIHEVTTSALVFRGVCPYPVG